MPNAAGILFVTPCLTAGGAERQWSILVPSLRARGHDARVIALDRGGAFEAPLRAAGVPLEVIGMRHQLDLGRLVRSELVRGFSPDVVISRGTSGLYVGHAIARLRAARHFFAEHRQVGLALSPRRARMFALLARRLDGAVLVAEGQAADWQSWGMPPQRLHLVRNGVPTSPVAQSREEIRAQLGLPADAVVAVSVASMRPEKRHADFVTAVRLAARRHPELTGVVVGDGVDRPAVEAAAGADPHVVLLGHRDDVAQILHAADLFVLASDLEAAPMAILEALAAGLPVIATAVGSVPDIITDGQTGRLVAPRAPQQLADALGQLTADAPLRAQMSAAARRAHRERFDADAMVDAYERLVTGSRNSAGAISR